MIVFGWVLMVLVIMACVVRLLDVAHVWCPELDAAREDCDVEDDNAALLYRLQARTHVLNMRAVIYPSIRWALPIVGDYSGSITPEQLKELFEGCGYPGRVRSRNGF